MERTTNPSRLTTLAAIVISVAVLYFAKDVLIPVALAVLLTFMLTPLVSRLERRGLPRVPAVVGVVLLVCLGIGIVGWLVAGQLADVTAHLPEYTANLREKLASIRDGLGARFEDANRSAREIGADLAQAHPGGQAERIEPVQVEVRTPPISSLQAIQTTLGPVFSVLGVAAVVVIFVVFMLLQREDLRDRIIRLAGTALPLTTQALDEASQRVSRYLLTQTLINGLHGVAVAVGLALIGFPNFLLWGLLSMLLRYIPYVGPWIAAAFPVFQSLAAYDGWSMPLLTIGLFAVLELLSNNWLEPWLYGTRTGVSPLAVLVSAVFWTWLWGGVGLVLSIPLTVCLAVMGKYVPQLKFLSILLGDEPVLAPQTRLYQRLLAADPEEAWRVLDAELESRGLLGTYDSVVIPALTSAEQDHRRGQLESNTRVFLLETLKELVAEAGEKVARTGAGGAPTQTNEPRASVLCIPARGEADHLAAQMLAQVLAEQGIDAEALSVDALASEALDRIAEGRTDLVCISAVPPTALAHARYLYKRVVARFPERPVVIGVWSEQIDRVETEQRIGCQANATVAATLAQARTQVGEALAAYRHRRPQDDASASASLGVESA